jgi:dCMP deaminase
MRLAYVTAERGSCNRKQVGALVVRDRDKRIIASGYNGAPRGMPDCIHVGCDVRVIDGRESCVRTLHAESNALDLCGPLSEPHTLYTTVIPCRNCALRIIQAGIQTVFYHEYYESQGTKEVEKLFADGDAMDFQSSIRDGKERRHARVVMQRVDLPMELVKPLWVEPSV